jgi:small subunit ribosomal protein S2
MSRTNFEELLEAGVHFGHLKSKWNPSMAPYIFTEKNGIHVIDLNKTVKKIDTAAAALKQIAKSGKKIMFVATKKQAKDIVSDIVKPIRMPFVTERWSGGMITNFATVRKSIRKMQAYDKMSADGTLGTMSKRERLQRARQREKLELIFGSISDMNRLPAALFIVDVRKEHIALAEARKLGIPVFAMVDTNSNPKGIDFVIPSNDDATKSISKIVGIMATAIQEGLDERKATKESKDSSKEAKETEKA